MHRSPVDRGETRFALQQLRDQIGRKVYPVHRLDKPTSGVLLFALTPQGAKHCAAQFAEHRVVKLYRAIVRGYTQDSGTIDHPFRDDRDSAIHQNRQELPIRPALTHYRTLGKVELPIAVDRYASARYSLVEINPVTGRRHQVRRHMKHIAHPIIGDAKHGKSIHNHFFARYFGVQRLFLACTEIRLMHPASAQEIVLRAPLEDEFERVIDRAGFLEKRV